MNNFLSRAFLLSLLLVPIPAQAAPQAVSAKVYAGDGGLEVTVIQLKEPDKYLIQVTGSKSAYDGLVLPYTVDSTGRRFTTSWRGMGYNFFAGDKSWNAETAYRLYAPSDVRVAHPVTYNEARTKAVKLGELLDRHDKQTKDGSLARFGRFDRPGEQASNEKELAEATQAFNKACQTDIPVAVAWSTIDEETMKGLSISGYCQPPVRAMERLCESPAARTEIKTKVKQVTCQFGAELKMDVDAKGTLLWTTVKGAPNMEDFAKKYWENAPVAGTSAPAPVKGDGELPPWGQGKTLGEKAILEKTVVCTDGKSAFVVRSQIEPGRFRLYYGNGKTLARVPRAANLEHGGEFLDPRQFNPTANPNFRGMDWRLYSAVAVDVDKKTCSVRCGVKRTELKMLDEKAAGDLLLAAKFTAPLHKRKPHVLTRDDKGAYYYVDRGNTPETEKDFKLYMGTRGNMKPLAMTNVVADSQGEIFSTKSGSLRFISGPGGSGSSWVQGKRVTKLTAIPVEENLQVIYNDLNVYRGQRLGMPCDDL